MISKNNNKIFRFLSTTNALGRKSLALVAKPPSPVYPGYCVLTTPLVFEIGEIPAKVVIIFVLKSIFHRNLDLFR